MSDKTFTCKITLVEEEYEQLHSDQELLIGLYNRLRLSSVSDDKHDEMLLRMDKFIHSLLWSFE